MAPQKFRAVVAASAEGRAVIAVPFDADEAWGAKASHPVIGTASASAGGSARAMADGHWPCPGRGRMTPP